MLASLLRDRDEPPTDGANGHLSHSRVNRYLLCPQQYRLHYLENLRPKVPPANLVFGQIVHQALAELFLKKGDPVKCFTESWGMLKDIPLSFNQHGSWEKFRASGEGLLTKFVSKELPRFSAVTAVEQPFRLAITTLLLPFIGIIDLMATVDGTKTLVDWKTAASAYDEYEAAMSDQLTAYKLVEPQTEQLALCVLVKTKEPQILWYRTNRTGEALTEYLDKVRYVAREITGKHFYKRSGMWCAWCDFLPVCLGDKRKVRESLVTIP